MKKNSQLKRVTAEETVRNGDKRAVYKWEDAGTEGVLRNIDKESLSFDHRYQREANDAKVTEIASKWWWMAAGVISVVERPDGELVVIDGQHRVLAAAKRSDVRTLPCIVYKVKNVAEEAKAFLAMNGNRKPVSALQKFRAKAVSGDQDAARVQQLVKLSGRTVSITSGPTTISCIASLERCAKTNWTALERLFPMLMELCDGHPMHKRVVDALHYIECRLAKEGVRSITTNPWRSRFLQIGHHELLHAASEAARYEGHAGARILADGILKLVNKGLKSNALHREQSA